VEHIDIAPLARRLAEENNVDWRRLRGSGERGRVVERDVLEYLARVMAGEEDVDPTPEPLPDGMAAWPDADVRAYHQERRDDTDLESGGPATVDDEIFLLEPDVGDDLLMDDFDDVGDVDEARVDDVAHDAGQRAADVPFASEGEERYGDRGFDDGDLSAAGAQGDDDDLLVAGDDEAEEAVAAAPADSPHEHEAHAPMAHHAADDHAPVDDALTQAAAPSAPLEPEASGELPDLFDDRPAATWQETPVFDDPGALDHPPSPGPALVGPGEPAPHRPTFGGALERAEVAAVATHAVATAPSATAPSATAPDSARDPVASPREALDPVPAWVPPAPASEGPRAGASAATLAGSALPLVRHGAIWRRQVDLGDLVAAQADVGRDLGLVDPVPLIAFLARAAAKALQEGSEIGVVHIDEYAVHTSTVDALAGPFAQLVTALTRRPSDAATSDGDGIGLFVADLSDVEVDEAVLHLDAPVLALGRVLIDSSTGGRRATLSLSGDAVGRDAARVLARVADLLETPIRIVL
jgi:hypothetical protein